MADVTGPVVLPADVFIVPVATLAPTLRRRLGAAPGDFGVGHAQARAWAKIVDAGAAALLQTFRRPTRIVEAVLAYSRARRTQAERVLTGVFPLLAELLNEGLLVAAGSPEAARVTPTFAPLDRVGSFTVVQMIRVLADTEVYQVRGRRGRQAALKIARSPAGSPGAVVLAQEAKALSRLGGSVAPRLLGTGALEGRPYLAMAWHQGLPGEVAARERRESGVNGRKRLHRLCGAILGAYTQLHADGVIHGDVHPDNILVGPGGRVTLLDFGFARVGRGQAGGRARRAGVPFYYEPELARALLRRSLPPPATLKGEQYAVAAMLYELVTGRPYLRFSLRQPELLRQIINEAPAAFARRGAEAWPDVEQVLRRALSKSPWRRFPSMGSFALAWRRAHIPTSAGRLAGAASRAERFVRSAVRPLVPGGSLMEGGLLPAPTASAHHGAAGVAHALYRMACARDDAELFAAADVWLSRAVRDADRSEAFLNPDLGVDAARAAEASLYHGAAGVFVVQAALAQAVGDFDSQQRAVDEFVRRSRRAGPGDDLASGTASTLLGCVLLQGTMADASRVKSATLRALARRTRHRLVRRLEHLGPVGRAAGGQNLGMAHGWAGLLYALLRWCEATGAVVPEIAARRLDEVAARGLPAERGLRWPWVGERPGEASGFMPGWCNGSGGFVHLWLVAHRLLGGPRYLALAEQAGLDVWTDRSHAATLCCGTAGRAYALLAVHRHTGERSWLERALRLADRSLRAALDSGQGDGPRYRHSLFRGTLGTALLLAELARPEDARMPLFEVA